MRRIPAILILAGFALMLFAVAYPVFAQASATTVSAGPWFDLLKPYLTELVSAIVAGIIGWVALMVKQYVGISIEQKHRDALHSAVMTGVSSALSTIGNKADATAIDVKSVAVKTAVEWAQKSVPDAIAYLGVTPDKIAEIASAKLVQLTAKS